MSKNRYFKELLSLLIRLELGKLFRHFKIGLYKHINTIGWFEHWHPIPRLICGYICGVLLVLGCLFVILPSAFIWSCYQKSKI